MGATLHAVIDAGSSGTRLFLYEVETGSYPIISPIAEIEHSTTPGGKREDGINNFVTPEFPEKQREVLNETIHPLLECIRPIIESHGVAVGDVKVDLFGTAGMRYAEKMYGPQVIKGFYDIIKYGVDAAGFTHGQIRTCDGFTEEGVWTWINLNDLEQDVFRTDNDPVGVLEVGGSSAQITYPKYNESPKDFVTTHVSINNRTFPIICNTYLGLGQDDARKSMRANLGNRANLCFPRGFKANIDIGDSLDGVGYFKLSNNGDYSFSECNEVYEEIIGDLDASNKLPNLSDSAIKFVATDAVYHATKFWDAQRDPQQLTKLVLDFCHNLDSFPGIETNEFVQAQAANATYIQALLYGKHGLFKTNPATLSHALSNKSEGKTRLTWTRGYLMQTYATSESNDQS